ncbi:MAG: hypothetical protein U5N56_03470 [Candidatus Marinimicrobia bacterium]|nr:hypothetical protein [Candidatus Neomarinimicrobiota bacterium]
MDKNYEKMMNDLHRLLEKKDFADKAEAEAFIDQYLRNELPSEPKSKLTAEEKAVDLVFDAYDKDPVEAMDNITEALRLDRNCINAYEYLGMTEPLTELAILFFEKGIRVGRKKFGGNYLKENKGYFWGLHETRPFMRCLHGYCDCLLMFGEKDEALAVMEEMIELNPGDNQGVRYQLLNLLLETGNYDKYEKYHDMYKDDVTAFILYHHALYSFIVSGVTRSTNNKLKKAIAANPHVPGLIISKKAIKEFPERYTPGEESEALFYIFYGKDLWRNTPGALKWLKSISG